MRQPRSVYDARWLAKNPDYHKEFWIANKERLSLKAKEEYKKNRERILARASAYYYAMTPEQRAEHNRKRRLRHANNPEIRNRIERIRDHNLRTTERITREKWEQICARFNNECVYCGTGENITIEHLVPVSRGGTNASDNLAPACHSCNSGKRNKTFSEYLIWRATRNVAVV